MASKFFPPPDDTAGKYALCERDYFHRLDLFCATCGEALRSSYITALDRKHHLQCFACKTCGKVFGAQDTYYEAEGNVYCFEHFVGSFASACSGCGLPILKQFVELDRKPGEYKRWHPHCYMVHKYWNVRMATKIKKAGDCWVDKDGHKLDVATFQQYNNASSARVEQTWTILSTFEEKAATMIGKMLQSMATDLRTTLVNMAGLLSMVGVLFRALDAVDDRRIRNGLSGKCSNLEL